jgi:two-component system, NtrC family, response regulator PilR
MESMLMLIADVYGRRIQFPLADEYNEITVGSLQENLIYLPYKGVSRRHFSLVRTGSAWFLKDQGSTNGTRLNGSLVNESIIKPDDLIFAGIVEFKVKELDSNNLIEIPDERPGTDHVLKTDKVGTFSRSLQDNIFVSDKLVFPSGLIPGKSKVMTEIYQRIHSLANSEVNVLLTGETGTGKEMLAHMLHLSGKRASGPFVAVNCAAIPSELLESELFGIGEKVATDVSSRKGKIQMADRGTLFLDELGTFPVALQAKILRAIEEKSVTRIGEHQTIAVDFRLISAMNENPAELISHGKLRQDIYHRVAGVEIAIPPLRERREDVPLLLIGLTQQISRNEKKPVAGISKQLFSLLTNYSYPGNVREMTNLLESMIALAHPGEILDLHLAPGKLLEQGANIQDDSQMAMNHGSIHLRQQVDELSRTLTLRALNLNDWNLTAAAKALGISRFGLRKMMKRLGIPLDKKT